VLTAPKGAEVVKVKTARDMERAVLKRIDKADCIIMTAAVCDFRPLREKEHKIKKREKLEIKLIKNPDILLKIRSKKLLKVGFALETEKALENGRKKLKTKNLDLIVINTKKKGMDPFGSGKKDYLMLSARESQMQRFKGVTKRQMAKKIINTVKPLVSGELDNE